MSLATSGLVRPALGDSPPVPPVFSTPPAAKEGRGEMVGFWTFTVLIVLGLLAAARAFFVM